MVPRGSPAPRRGCPCQAGMLTGARTTAVLPTRGPQHGSLCTLGGAGGPGQAPALWTPWRPHGMRFGLGSSWCLKPTPRPCTGLPGHASPQQRTKVGATSPGPDVFKPLSAACSAGLCRMGRGGRGVLPGQGNHPDQQHHHCWGWWQQLPSVPTRSYLLQMLSDHSVPLAYP